MNRLSLTDSNDQKWIIRTHCQHTMDRSLIRFEFPHFQICEAKKKKRRHIFESSEIIILLCVTKTVRTQRGEKKKWINKSVPMSSCLFSLCFTHEFWIDFTHTDSSQERDAKKISENKLYRFRSFSGRSEASNEFEAKKKKKQKTEKNISKNKRNESSIHRVYARRQRSRREWNTKHNGWSGTNATDRPALADVPQHVLGEFHETLAIELYGHWSWLVVLRLCSTVTANTDFRFFFFCSSSQSGCVANSQKNRMWNKIKKQQRIQKIRAKKKRFHSVFTCSRTGNAHGVHI